MKLIVSVSDMRRKWKERKLKKALSKAQRAYDSLYSYEVQPQVYDVVYKNKNINGVDFIPPMINE